MHGHLSSRIELSRQVRYGKVHQANTGDAAAMIWQHGINVLRNCIQHSRLSSLPGLNTSSTTRGLVLLLQSPVPPAADIRKLPVAAGAAALLLAVLYGLKSLYSW